MKPNHAKMTKEMNAARWQDEAVAPKTSVSGPATFVPDDKVPMFESNSETVASFWNELRISVTVRPPQLTADTW